MDFQLVLQSHSGHFSYFMILRWLYHHFRWVNLHFMILL
jgi:hypothetical protein